MIQYSWLDLKRTELGVIHRIPVWQSIGYNHSRHDIEMKTIVHMQLWKL